VAADDTGRPYHHLDTSKVVCPKDADRHHEDAGGGETLTWCALADGRKHGPELFFHAGGLRHEYTEYAVGLEQGLYVVTDSHHRVIVEGRFLGGQRDGIWSVWGQDGLVERCDYRDPATLRDSCSAPD
jgi:hypothetical protein